MSEDIPAIDDGDSLDLAVSHMKHITGNLRPIGGARQVARGMKEMQPLAGLAHVDFLHPLRKSTAFSPEPSAGELDHAAHIEFHPANLLRADRQSCQIIVFVKAAPVLTQSSVVME